MGLTEIVMLVLALSVTTWTLIQMVRANKNADELFWD